MHISFLPFDVSLNTYIVFLFSTIFRRKIVEFVAQNSQEVLVSFSLNNSQTYLSCSSSYKMIAQYVFDIRSSYQPCFDVDRKKSVLRFRKRATRIRRNHKNQQHQETTNRLSVGRDESIWDRKVVTSFKVGQLVCELLLHFPESFGRLAITASLKMAYRYVLKSLGGDVMRSDAENGGQQKTKRKENSFTVK